MKTLAIYFSDVSEEMQILCFQKFIYLLNILCYKECKLDVSKSVVTTMEFTTEDDISLNGVWLWKVWHTYTTSTRCFLTQDEYRQS